MAGMLTSQDVLHAEFKKVIRGYDTKEVDFFLDEVVGTFEQYNEKISKLEAQIEKNREQLESFEQTRELMQSTLLMAQKSAEARVAKARQEAKQIIETAQKEAQDIRNGAYSEKSDLRAKLENIRKLREGYMAEAKEIVSRFGELLHKCEQPTEIMQQTDKFIASSAPKEESAPKEAKEPEKAEVKVEFASEGLRFEYEEEKSAVTEVKTEGEENAAEDVKPSVQNSSKEFEVTAEAEEPKVEPARQKDEFTLFDSEEQLKKDAEAELAAKKQPDEKEAEAADLAHAEKLAFTDENQSNLFGEETEPMKAATEIRYAETEDLDF